MLERFFPVPSGRKAYTGTDSERELPMKEHLEVYAGTAFYRAGLRMTGYSPWV